MPREVVQQVREAEQQAEKTIEQAHQRADQIIAEARKQIDEIKTKILAAADEEVKNLMEQAKTDGELRALTLRGEFDKKIEQIRQKAQANMPQAIELLVKKLTE